MGHKNNNIMPRKNLVIFVAHRHPGPLSPNHLAKFKRPRVHDDFIGLIFNIINNCLIGWICNTCGGHCTNQSGLTNHIRTTHPAVYATLKKPSYKCMSCERCFEKPSNLAQHTAAHMGGVTQKGP